MYVIKVRTVKIYTDYCCCKSDLKKQQDQLRTLLMQKLDNGEVPQSKGILSEIIYCVVLLNY